MRVIFDYCSEPKRSGDGQGLCLIELEENETLQDVIDKYMPKDSKWYQRQYSSPQELDRYSQHLQNTNKTIVHTGRLVLMNTTMYFID